VTVMARAEILSCALVRPSARSRVHRQRVRNGSPACRLLLLSDKDDEFDFWTGVHRQTGQRKLCLDGSHRAHRLGCTRRVGGITSQPNQGARSVGMGCLLTQQQQRCRLEAIVRGDADLVQLLEAARELHLPQWRIVVGCLYQTVSNVLLNKPARTGIKAYDPICFDSSVLSREVEDQVVQRVRRACAISPVRNQARVHLWLKQRFRPRAPKLRR